MIKKTAFALIETAAVLLGVVVAVFGMRYLAGDPVGLYAPLDATPEQLDAIRSAHGLDRPIYEQFFDYVGGLLRGDLGTSLQSRRPALDVVLERLPATVELTLWAFIPAAIIGIVVGTFAAARRNSLIDKAAMGFSLFGLSVPVYWAGAVAILLVAVVIPIFPTGGRGSPLAIVLPAVTLGLATAARASRMARASVVGQLNQRYVLTARAKGVSESRIVVRHALRNSLATVVTVLALDLGVLLGGAVITETIFAWPGIGRLAAQSIAARDFPVVQAIVLLVAVGYVVIFRLLNLTYRFLDPRTETGR